jgi:hypothetical protein
MLLSKLRAVVAVAFAVCVSAAALGLSFQTGAAQAPPAPTAERPLADELEELRLEVAALRKGLEANRERVKALEAEVQTLKRSLRPQGPFGGGGPGGWRGSLSGSTTGGGGGGSFSGSSTGGQSPFGGFSSSQAAQPSDPLAEAEAALRKLRERPDDPQATGALEKALKRLKERAKPDGAAGNPKKD